MYKLYNQDCLDVMKDMQDNSVDLIVTDPPYKVTSRGSSGGTGGMLKSEINKKGMVLLQRKLKAICFQCNLR